MSTNDKACIFFCHKSVVCLWHRDLAASRVYQLVHRNVDLAHFSSMVRRDSLAYRVGLELMTHQRGVISDVRRDVTVKIKATKHRLRAVTAYLTDRSDKCPKKDRYYPHLLLSQTPLPCSEIEMKCVKV